MLSKQEKRVVELIKNDGVGFSEAARRLKLSRGAVRTYYVRAIKKLVPGGGFPQEAGGGGTPGWLATKLVRLHGVVWVVRLLRSGLKYRRWAAGGGEVRVLGSFVKGYRDRLVIHPRESFFGLSEVEAEGVAFRYADRLAARLENDLGVVLRKDRSQNWERRKAHFATVDSSFAKGCVGREVDVRASAGNGTVDFVVDRSGFFEHEAVNGRESLVHSELMNDVIGGWLDGSVVTPRKQQAVSVVHEERLRRVEGVLGVAGIPGEEQDSADSRVRPDYFG